jgi:hypothetical protein
LDEWFGDDDDGIHIWCAWCTITIMFHSKIPNKIHCEIC